MLKYQGQSKALILKFSLVTCENVNQTGVVGHDRSYTNLPDACCISHVGDSVFGVVELSSHDLNTDYVLS